MKNYTLNLNPSINGLNGFEYPKNPIIFKGESKLNLDLNNLKNGTHDIIQVDIDFDDKNSSDINISDKFSFTNSFSASNPIYSHIYQAVSDTNYYFRYYLTIDIRFSNFTTFRNKFDIVVYKDSFYSLHKKFAINSAQFVDDDDNSMFVVIRNDNGDKFNFIIK
jgi:hypothetical protein